MLRLVSVVEVKNLQFQEQWRTMMDDVHLKYLRTSIIESGETHVDDWLMVYARMGNIWPNNQDLKMKAFKAHAEHAYTRRTKSKPPKLEKMVAYWPT
jgi:hypothetical protein